MKLTSIEILPVDPLNALVLSFRDPKSLNPYNVKSITGLDAEEITPKYYGSYSIYKMYNLSLQRREVVIKLGLNPDFSTNESYSDLRDKVYKIISSSRTGKVQLVFKNDTTVKAAVTGFIIKYETAQFEKTQEIQLTIKCDQPMLQAPNLSVVPNVSLLNPANTIITDAESTAPHGFQFAMTVLANTAAIVITDPDNVAWHFNIVFPFLTNDIIQYSSLLNNKYLYVTRAGSDIPIGDKIQLGSIWPIMFPGPNKFAFTNFANLQWTYISYYPTYWGV